MTVRVGTSGWQYADWRGPFYPAKLPQRAWLSAYCDSFDTVEDAYANNDPGAAAVRDAIRLRSMVTGRAQPAANV